MRRGADQRRLAAMAALTRADVPYTTNNGGIHLMIGTAQSRIDFWPTTGRWRDQRGATGRGLDSLFTRLGLDLPKNSESLLEPERGGDQGGTAEL